MLIRSITTCRQSSENRNPANPIRLPLSSVRMKYLVCLALVGLIVFQVCNAQTTCTPEQIQDLATDYNATCTNPTCLADICICCTGTLRGGSSGPTYDCCTTYRDLLQCGNPDSLYMPCAALSGGGNGGASIVGVTTTVAFVLVLAWWI